MAKFVDDTTLDYYLDYIAHSDVICVCSTQPTNYTEAYTTYKIASSSDLTTASFTIADAAGGGRQVTVAATSGLSIEDTADALHVALCGQADTTLRYVTTCTQLSLTSGGTVDIPAFVITLGDPT